MDEEKNREPLVVELFGYFAIAFTLTILAITVIGVLSARFLHEGLFTSNLFTGNEGLSYNSIIKLAGLSFVLAVFALLLFSERFPLKIRFFWRVSLLLLSVFFATAIFIIVFEVFCINDLQSWLYFMLFSATCFTIVIVLMLLRIKFESKKFNQLLKDYKARHNNSKKEF